MVERLEILNSQTHRHVRMYAPRASYPHYVQIFPEELATAGIYCPVFLSKDSNTGRFYIGAMFGLKPGELQVDGVDDGSAAFQPLDLQRQGFFTAGEHLALNLDDARFADNAPIALFDAAGEPSDELRAIQHLIGRIVAGQQASDAFIAAMLAIRAIEPITISLDFDDGDKLVLDGLYTISLDALNELEDNAIAALFRQGYLQAALCIRQSQQLVGVLAQRRNQTLGLRL